MFLLTGKVQSSPTPAKLVSPWVLSEATTPGRGEKANFSQSGLFHKTSTCTSGPSSLPAFLETFVSILWAMIAPRTSLIWAWEGSANKLVMQKAKPVAMRRVVGSRYAILDVPMLAKDRARVRPGGQFDLFCLPSSAFEMIARNSP